MKASPTLSVDPPKWRLALSFDVRIVSSKRSCVDADRFGWAESRNVHRFPHPDLVIGLLI